MNKEELLIYKVHKILDEVGLLGHHKINTNVIIEILLKDLKSYIQKDPASEENYNLIINSYTGFLSLIGYRVANYIINQLKSEFYQIKAREISEKIKSKTGIEIHPKAQIGEYFVLDHGFGTVIGETTIIGKNCYILQGVILGGRSIASNSKGKRHPTIGNSVEIGAFSRILGNITIGDNVFIAPHSIITKNIPSNSKILNFERVVS